MDTQSPDIEVDVPTVLQLGERALSQLELQVRVAQIEAKKAELELILEQAHRGDVAPLQRWLRVHGQYVPASTPSGTAPADEETDTTSPLPDTTPPNWEVYRRLAIERLRRRHLSTTSSVAVDVRLDAAHSTLDAEAGSADSHANPGPTQASPAALLSFDVAATEASPTPGAEESLESHQDSALLSDPEIDRREIVPLELLAELNVGVQASAEDQTAVRRGRWRGVIISAVFHLVVVFVLAAVTLDSPMKDGLLSLVASDTSSSAEVESFELTQELEVQEPAAESVETPTPTAEPNLAEALPSLNSSLSEALSQTAATTSAESKSSMMAAKADTSKEMVSFYGAESSGNSFCFVVDGSGSMRGGPWEAARIELLRSIGSLKHNQKFYIIFFNQEVMAISEPGKNSPARSPLYATPENIAHAKRWLDTLQIMTGDPPMKAMEAALQLECDCIYFLADGEMSESIAKKLLDTLRKHNRAHDIIDGEVVLIPIHTIAYYSDKGLDIMRKIAEENRGQFAYVAKPKTSRKK